MSDLVSIASKTLSAAISPLGAELQLLRDEEGRDLLWNGDPAFWTGRAPLLFPIVGALNGGTLHVDGQAFALEKHGFARRRTFALVAHEADTAHFRLEADEKTRALYPFDFRLDVRFSIAGAALTVAATVTNPSERALPASFGYHPAFRWPLPYGGARADHRLLFAQAEPEPIRRINGTGQILPDPRPTPVEGAMLAPTDALFADDALIFDRIRSRSVRYGVPGQRGIEVRWPDTSLLGVWTKPGAGFLCIEPWHGLADPAGFEGDLRDKPAIVEIAPGAQATFTMTIALV